MIDLLSILPDWLPKTGFKLNGPGSVGFSKLRDL